MTEGEFGETIRSHDGELLQVNRRLKELLEILERNGFRVFCLLWYTSSEDWLDVDHQVSNVRRDGWLQASCVADLLESKPGIEGYIVIESSLLRREKTF